MTEKQDAVVIGGGLFGSIIAAALSTRLDRVMIIDDARPGRGSLPAACLMKPSWFSGLGQDIWVPALRLLEELYGVHNLEFSLAGFKSIVHWCDPAAVLTGGDRLLGTVTRLWDNPAHWSIGLQSGRVIEANRVVVATGHWAEELVPVDGGIKPLSGAAFLWPRQRIERPFIRPGWAPYKQIVAFNRGDGLWCGDGTAILKHNWTAEREGQSLRRCADAVGMSPSRATTLWGVRPYSKVKPCYLANPQDDLWVATGGAKNGTLAAGWAAHMIRESL